MGCYNLTVGGDGSEFLTGQSAELWLLFAFGFCVLFPKYGSLLMEPSGATADKVVAGGRVVAQHKQEAGGTMGTVCVRKSRKSSNIFRAVTWVCHLIPTGCPGAGWRRP